MSSTRLREHLEQLAPKSEERNTQDLKRQAEIEAVELTDDELKAVLFSAKKNKLELLELEERKKQYWNQLTAPPSAKFFTAEQLRYKLLASKTSNGKYYEIDKHNQAQVNTLCLYFSGDPRLEEYGFSHSKGLLLMGGLGVGKTHLMSFFTVNQKASYVMHKCNDIENKWLKEKDADVDAIEYFSEMITGYTNSNPYGHERLGICFDDLGRETIPSKRYGEEKNVMAEVLMNRYDRKMNYRYTHITTNLNGEQLINLYGDRLNDRLVEMCNVIVFPSDARSRRQ
jgi:DNA replication protein DnaC